MGIDRTVTCGNCGAKGPWDSEAYDGAGDEQEMWNHRRIADDTETIQPIADAFVSRDWRKFAKLVVEASEIEPIGLANHAVRLIAEEAITRLGREKQMLHLESVTNWALDTERRTHDRGTYELH